MFANNQDPNDWFAENFNGMLVETSAKGYEDSIDYRAWTQLKKQKKFILPMLTLPKDSGYMISAPTTFLVLLMYYQQHSKFFGNQNKPLLLLL